LHRQQPEKDKQSFDIVPLGKISADADGCIDFNLLLIKLGPVGFNSFKSLDNDKCQVVSFLNPYVNAVIKKLYNFDAW